MPSRMLMPDSPITYEQWFENPYIETLTSSDQLGWNCVHVSTAVLNPGRDFFPSPKTEDYTLITGLEGSTRMKIRVNSSMISNVWGGPGEIEIIPPHIEADSLWDTPITAGFVRLSSLLVKNLASEMFRNDPERIEVPLNLKFSDPLLRELIAALCAETYSSGAFGELYVESLTHTLVLHLLRHYSNATPMPALSVSRSKLTVVQMRVIDDYIHTYLEQKLTLDDLARCLHMSVSHFERLFRASYGYSPYHYVLEQRIERAKSLLANAQLSLHDVARQSGFANQSHLTKHFTKLVGCSPARYRARHER